MSVSTTSPSLGQCQRDLNLAEMGVTELKMSSYLAKMMMGLPSSAPNNMLRIGLTAGATFVNVTKSIKLGLDQSTTLAGFDTVNGPLQQAGSRVAGNLVLHNGARLIQLYWTYSSNTNSQRMGVEFDTATGWIPPNVGIKILMEDMVFNIVPLYDANLDGMRVQRAIIDITYEEFAKISSKADYGPIQFVIFDPTVQK